MSFFVIVLVVESGLESRGRERGRRMISLWFQGTVLEDRGQKRYEIGIFQFAVFSSLTPYHKGCLLLGVFLRSQ